MSWSNLKAGISAVIKENNNQEITGTNLQNVLITMVNSLGANATYGGIAHPNTSPGTPDGPVFWIASEPGVYSNFGNTEIDNTGIFTWNGASWSFEELDFGDNIEIVNDLITGGSTKVLSAEMGKLIKDNVQTILNALGEYAFPNGKPTIDWSGGTLAVILNLSDFTSSNMSNTTQRGEAYTTTLTPAHSSNLYVNDVVIMMGDEDITATAYNALTGIVSIAEVTGAIEITASQETYVQDGLVLHLDGKNRGGTSGHWISLVNYNGAPIDFTLTNCDETHDDYVAFNGTTSKGVGSVSLLDVPAESGTIEAAYNGGELNSNQYGIMHNALGSNKRICLASWNQNNDANNNLIVICAASSDTLSLPLDIGAKFSKASITSGGVISCSKGNFKINQQSQLSYAEAFQIADNTSMLSLFWQKLASDEKFFKGNLQSLRVYNRILTDAERAQNKRVDEKRFNLI